jgi:hypothetical protein
VLGEFLRRFREGGVPGAPSAAGVPSDRVAALEAELAPVFALFEDAEQAADRIAADGARGAELRRAQAAEQTRALVAGARARAAGEQAAAAAERFARTDDACAALRRSGEAEAVRIARAAAERVPILAGEVVERILSRTEPERPS